MNSEARMIIGEKIKPLLWVQIACVLALVVVKNMLRPLVLQSEAAEVLEVFVLSFPNLCEGIIGSVTVTMVLLFVKGQLLRRGHSWIPAEKPIYLFSVIFSAVYVISQEFKLHNLGGQNVYDPYDVLYSCIGLLMGYLILRWIRPRMLLA